MFITLSITQLSVYINTAKAATILFHVSLVYAKTLHRGELDLNKMDICALMLYMESCYSLPKRLLIYLSDLSEHYYLIIFLKLAMCEWTAHAQALHRACGSLNRELQSFRLGVVSPTVCSPTYRVDSPTYSMARNMVFFAARAHQIN